MKVAKKKTSKRSLKSFHHTIIQHWINQAFNINQRKGEKISHGMQRLKIAQIKRILTETKASKRFNNEK